MEINDFPNPHIPALLPNDELVRSLLSNNDVLSAIINNGQKLSEFIGYLQNIPAPEVLISSLTLQEAVLSSKIEGTLATIEDVVSDSHDSDSIKQDIIEIGNYVNAVRYGRYELEHTNCGISKHLIKLLHICLMENNVRGANKTPGEFKTEQNFIANNALGNYTPLPPLLVDEYIDNLVDYIRDVREISPLLQAAIIHVQFEMIHPFKDGNGRVGRLLIPLFLYYKKIIPFPIFYISRYFEQQNDRYKLYLSNISKTDNDDDLIAAWKDWILFFFDGVAKESVKHIETSKRIIALRNEMISSINKTDMIPLIDFLFDNLRIVPSEAIEKLGLPNTSVYRELRRLADNGYLMRSGTPRKTIYLFNKLVSIIQ